MNFKKALIAASVCAGMGLAAAPASAVVLTFANNTNATPDYDAGGTNGGGGWALGDFAPNMEFRVPSSSGTSVSDGEKDVFSGGETWTFDGSGNMTAGVAVNNSGAATSAPVTSGEVGYPLCAPNTCTTMQNPVDFLSAGNFSMAVPTVGDALATATGKVTTIDTSGLSGTPVAGETFSVFFPVLYTQWANGTYVIGHGGGATAALDWAAAPGVTAIGTMTDDNNFIIRFNYQMTRGEVTQAGFKNSYVELEALGCFDGNCGSAVVPVPAAVWLFGSGLIGLVGVARRKRQA